MMRLASVALVFVFSFMLSACEKVSDMSIEQDDIKTSDYGSSGRFKVERVSVFYDKLAYDRKRGVYVITDTETGKQFVGVSGVGVSELGSHPSGKVTATDER
jgi:hypothetical protein